MVIGARRQAVLAPSMATQFQAKWAFGVRATSNMANILRSTIVIITTSMEDSTGIAR
jgi:hypothetical protein